MVDLGAGVGIAKAAAQGEAAAHLDIAAKRRAGIAVVIAGIAILRVLIARYPSAHIVIRDARVQGEGAAEDLTRALRAVTAVDGVDVVNAADSASSVSPARSARWCSTSFR